MRSSEAGRRDGARHRDADDVKHPHAVQDFCEMKIPGCRRGRVCAEAGVGAGATRLEGRTRARSEWLMTACMARVRVGSREGSGRRWW